LEALTGGHVERPVTPNAIADRRSTAKGDEQVVNVTHAQFVAMLHWTAWVQRISYGECVGKLFNRKVSQRQKLASVFAEFAHRTSQGLMTISEFTRFCRHFHFFVPDRFVEGDVYFLFQYSGEGKAVDFHGFLRLVAAVAVRLDKDVHDLHRLLLTHAES